VRESAGRQRSPPNRSVPLNSFVSLRS
jgi:hypothetical protein